MKMEKKQCKKCKHFLLFECFKKKKKNPSTKCCIKSLDNCKMSRQQTKCKHEGQRSKCLFCGRGHICEPNKQRSSCKDCDGSQFVSTEDKDHNAKIVVEVRFVSTEDKGHNAKIVVGLEFVSTEDKNQVAKVVVGVKFVTWKTKIKLTHMRSLWIPSWGRARPFYTVLKNDKEMSSTEHLEFNIETLKQHIEQQFTESMSWEYCGEWHIDHKIPLKYNKPSLEGVAKRQHYTNTQPVWASENMLKVCRYISGCLEQT